MIYFQNSVRANSLKFVIFLSLRQQQYTTLGSGEGGEGIANILPQGCSLEYLTYFLMQLHKVPWLETYNRTIKSKSKKCPKVETSHDKTSHVSLLPTW
jgi:hypothetical protein